jgi:hypothetical protein
LSARPRLSASSWGDDGDPNGQSDATTNKAHTCIARARPGGRAGIMLYSKGPRVHGAGPFALFDDRSAECRPQAVSMPASFSSPNSLIDISRILYFWILPVTVIGNSVTNL